MDLETPIRNLKDDDSALLRLDSKMTTERAPINNRSSQNSKNSKNDSLRLSLGSNESPSKRDGWLAYRKVLVLGEGSYGKVYKVLRKTAPTPVENLRKKQSIFDDPLQIAESALFPSSPPFLVIKELQTDLMPKKEAL